MRALNRVVVLSLAFSSAAFAAKDKKSESRQVGEFDGVSVQSGIHAVVAIGGRSVEVISDSETLAKVVTEVKDGVLEIGFDRPRWGFHFGNDREVMVRVTTPRLASVESSGGSHVEVAATTERKVRLSASGGGTLNVERVAGAREVAVRASGGATVNAGGIEAADLIAGGSGGAVLSLAGRAEEAELSFSGGTVIKGQKLALQRAVVHGSGGGEASARIADAVKGGLSGGASLHVDGSPRSNVRTSGGGEVVYADGHDRSSDGRARSGRRRHHDDDDEDDNAD